MAEKTTVGYLPGSDPEAMEANFNYQQAQQRMQAALEARKNRFFDPEMLALAQGFLAPTQTGGFGESLGLAARNLREAQTQQEKEEREIAESQLGLARQGLELERLKGRERLSKELFGMPSATTTTGGLPGPTGQGGPLTTLFERPAAPPGFNATLGVRTMPPNPELLKRRNQFIQASIAQGTDPATILKDLVKFDESLYQKSDKGTQDLASGLFFHSGTELAPKQIFTREGGVKTINVTPGQAGKLDELAGNGDPEYYNLVDRITKAPPTTRPAAGGAPQAPGQRAEAPAVAGEGRPEVRSAEEIEQEKNYRAQRGQLSAKEQSDEAQNWYKRGSDASGLIDDIRVIRGIFDPRNKYSQVLSGRFEQGDIKSQIGTLIESGLTGEALAKAARQIATNANLPPDAVMQFQVAVSRMADLKLKASTILAGQGSITEPERRLIAESVINITDTPKSIIAKAEYLQARAEFEARRAEMLREFRDDKRDYNDFVRSAEYKKLKKDYEDGLERIVERRLGIKLPPRGQSGRDNEGAASRLPPSVR